MAQSPFSQWQQPAADPTAGWEFSSPAPQRPAWALCPVLSALSAPPGYIVTSSSLCGSGSLGCFPATDGCAWPCTGNHQPQRAQQRRSEVYDDVGAADSCSGNVISQRQPSWEVDPLTAAIGYGGYWEPLGRRSFEAPHPDAINMAHPAATGHVAPAAAQPGGCMAAPMHPQHPSMFSWGPGASVPYSNSYQHHQQQQAVLYPPAAPAPVVHIQPPRSSSSYRAAPCAGASSSNSSSSRAPVSPVTLLCCNPPALPVGLASEVHLFLSGTVPSAAAGAGQMMPAAPGAVQPAPYRLQLTRGRAVVLEAQGWCSAVNPVISFPLPALPAGTLQLHLSFPSNSCRCLAGSHEDPTITHTLLVLMGPAAAELSSYWSELVVAAAVNNNNSSSSCGYQAASCIPSNFPAAAAGPWAPSAAALAGPGMWSMEVQVNGHLQQLTVHPSAVQSAWHQQYMPLAEDILSLMAPVPAAGPTNTWTGQQQYSCSGQTAEVSVAAREALGGLVERLAGKGMWALLQLLTDQVFGGGSSAKALFSANMAAAAGGRAPADNTAAIAAPAAAAAAAEEALAGSGGAATPGASDASPSSGRISSAGGPVGPQELQRSPNAQPLARQAVLGCQEQGNSTSTAHNFAATTSSSSCQHEAVGFHPDTPPADPAAALPQTALTRRGASAAAPHTTHSTTSGHGSNSGTTSAPSSRRHSQLISSADVAARTGSLEMPEWFEQGLLHSLTPASSGGSDLAVHVEWPSFAGSAGSSKHTSAAAEVASSKQTSAAAAESENQPDSAAGTFLAPGAVGHAKGAGSSSAGGDAAPGGSSTHLCGAPSSAGAPLAAVAAATSPPPAVGLQQQGTVSEDPARFVDTSSSCSSMCRSGDATCAPTTNNNKRAVNSCALLPAWLWQGLLVVLGLLDVAVMAALLAWLLRAL